MLALVSLARRAMCATARRSRANRAVGRRANDLVAIVGLSLARSTGSKRGLCFLARSRCVARHIGLREAAR